MSIGLHDIEASEGIWTPYLDNATIRLHDLIFYDNVMYPSFNQGNRGRQCKYSQIAYHKKMTSLSSITFMNEKI